VATNATKKAEAEKKPAAIKRLLGKRVDVAKGNKMLSRDVKTPKWLKAIGGYFIGSWRELREVRWPTRRATWSFTSAVIIFTVVLTAFILGLDYGFEQLFKKVIL
jgi:preprotein translocase SecE subunit